MIQPNWKDVAYRKQFLLDSTPPYYDESAQANGIMGANAKEIERKRAEADDLLNQLFIQTATWGLDYWDRVLDLEPAPRMALNRRRERILVKLKGSATATKKNLEEVADIYLNGLRSRIEERASEYGFIVHVPPESDLTAGVIEAVEELKPAHLEMSFATQRDFDFGIFIGGAVSEYQITNILTPKFEMPDLHTSISYGALVAKYETTQIGTLPFTIPDLQISNSYGGVFSNYMRTTILAKEVV